jgi:hypothetical protein
VDYNHVIHVDLKYIQHFKYFNYNYDSRYASSVDYNHVIHVDLKYIQHFKYFNYNYDSRWQRKAVYGRPYGPVGQ